MCNDVLKTNFACIRKWSYPSVNDTEKYDRNTEPGIPLKYGNIRSRRPYLAVYGRKRAWAFDLGGRITHHSCQKPVAASSPPKKKKRNGKFFVKEPFTRQKEYNILREHLVSTEASVSGAPLITTTHDWLTLSSSTACSTRIQSYEILRFNGVHIGALSHLEPANDAMVTLG